MSETELGQAARRALAAGDLAAAEQACRSLAEAVPGDAWPWTMLSELALRRRDAEAALAHASRAVTLAPKLLLAHVLLAKTLLQRGEPARALATADAAAAIEEAPAEALDGLGAIFGMLGRHRQAQALFRRAVAAAPAAPQFQFNLAATERMLGEFEAAEARCDALLAREPGHALVLSLRADLRSQTPERNHVAALEALLEAGGATDPVILHYALGKEYEDLGDDRNAFRHFSAGAALHRRRLNYQVGQDLAVVDRVMRTQTASWLATVPRGTETAQPVFVAGLPRSGTTVVERIIAGHSALVSAGETGLFPAEIARAVREARGGPPNLLTLGRRYIEAVTGFAVPKGSRFLDKTLQNYLYCGLIHAALPQARIILVRRHPLDTCFALYKAHFTGTFPFSYDLEELAQYYLAFDRLARHWREILPASAFREVQYEAVVADLAGESRKLMGFLGLPWEEAVLRFHESAAPSATASAVQVRRPLYTSSIGRWRRHAEALEPLRARLARELPAAALA
jgi:tetratricopeptide (TPR) repeat protein